MSDATGAAKRKHHWAAGGVSGYPLEHSIVGQTKFFNLFRQFIHIFQDPAQRFAQLFAVIAQWGIGKSRLAYELMGQINDTSPGWFVRDATGGLEKARLFDSDDERRQYLGLYVRYSQIATDSQNIDNWFGFGLYKALLPLTREQFDTSIQGQIAKEAYDRLLVEGFESKKLAEVLEVSANHSEEVLYEDPVLVTRLCEAAYLYLRQFGIRFILIALDELETAAEAATYGMEVTEMKYLDGRAIKLIGKAIKEEDPRGKFPWLRYVALCSPAIGDELRNIRSTERRFELVDLDANPFSDVSNFVQLLRGDDRLSEDYPDGLVEAAYAMSCGNFGWFNVIMANVDNVLKSRRLRGQSGGVTLGSLFDETADVSSRMSEHVLDRQALQELQIAREQLPAARELLYGQLPVPLTQFSGPQRQALLGARNEYGEPITLLYQRVEWSEQDCSKALRAAKFTRDRDDWFLAGVDQPLSLKQLLANLSTYSIHETKGAAEVGGRHVLLVPLKTGDFVQLVSMLYPHPAAEDAARAIWREQLGVDAVGEDLGTHLGPSMDMLGRLNLRFRKQGATALILRHPDQSAAHETAMAACKGQSDEDRARQILTAAMRTLDEHWGYDAVDAGLKGGPPAIITAPGTGPGGKEGLIRFDALRLHPKSKLILAWVRSPDELEELCRRAGSLWETEGRIPVIAFTPSRHLVDQFEAKATALLRDAPEYLMLYQLSSREEYVLHPIGLATRECQSRGFALNAEQFTKPFSDRLNALRRPLVQAIHDWRRELDRRGRIAWPMRIGGPMKETDQEAILLAYRYLFVENSPPKPLAQLGERSGVDVQQALEIIERMRVSTKARAAGYADSERCGLFSPLDETAEPQYPAFFDFILQRLYRGEEWSIEKAEKEWFWGYAWEGAKPIDTYLQWMSLARRLDYAYESSGGQKKNDKRYRHLERAALNGALTEARNWLTRDYPQIVEEMKAVFGEGKVGEYFAPQASAKPGGRTLEAKQKLDDVQSRLSVLQTAETAARAAIAEADRRQRFLECASARLSICRDLNWVYSAENYGLALENDDCRTLSFESSVIPLWEQIGKAKVFVDFVLGAKQRIVERIGQLTGEMRAETQDLSGFPVKAFTLSLTKIENILAGSIGTAEPAGETQRMQYITSGTLGHALRNLNVTQARGKLSQLAEEVGLDLDTGTRRPLAEINGAVVRGYHDLKTQYEKLIANLSALGKQIEAYSAILQDAPADFTYPQSVPAMAELASRPQLIEGRLSEILADDIDALISEHDPVSRLGNFQPLMEAVKGLMGEAKAAVGTLAGHVRTLENVVQDYREKLLANEELRAVERAYNALLQAQRKSQEKVLDITDMEKAGSLKAAKELVDDRYAQWSSQGQAILAATEVTFSQWSTIVANVESHQPPSMTTQQADNLVARGFLERTYRLGGQP